MNCINIRHAKPGDAERISLIIRDSFSEFKHFYTKKTFEATTIAADEVLQRMRQGCVWVALKDEEIIGTVAVIKKGEEMYMRGMSVLPESRGSRAGWMLLEAVEKYAIEKNVIGLLLSTTPYLSAAIHLYKKFGFEQVGEMDDSFYGTLIFQMRKHL